MRNQARCSVDHPNQLASESPTRAFALSWFCHLSKSYSNLAGIACTLLIRRTTQSSGDGGGGQLGGCGDDGGLGCGDGDLDDGGLDGGLGGRGGGLDGGGLGGV